MTITNYHFFTASFGSFDTVKPQPIHVSRYDESNAHFPMHTQDNRMKAKFYKMLAHRITDAPLIGWIDGNVQIKSPTFDSDMVKALSDCDVVLSRHPFRGNAVQEATFITTSIHKGNEYLSARYSADSIASELNSMPESWMFKGGLYWCGLFLRRNNPKVNAAFEDWFMENVLWTNFDQNSFVKIIHKHGLKVATVEWGSFYDNDTYKIEKHLK